MIDHPEHIPTSDLETYEECGTQPEASRLKVLLRLALGAVKAAKYGEASPGRLGRTASLIERALGLPDSGPHA